MRFKCRERDIPVDEEGPIGYAQDPITGEKWKLLRCVFQILIFCVLGATGQPSFADITCESCDKNLHVCMAGMAASAPSAASSATDDAIRQRIDKAAHQLCLSQYQMCIEGSNDVFSKKNLHCLKRNLGD
jgi:hypothetical protein